MGGGGGGSSGPVYHKRGAELAGFSTQQLLETRGLGNPYVNEELARRGLDEQGTPIGPKWESLAGDSGLLKNQYQVSADIAPNMKALEAYRARALGTEPSAWAKMAEKQQGLEEAGLRSRLGEQAGAAAAQARSGLASRQGLSVGASERLAAQSMRDQLRGQQNVAAQGALQRAQIGSQDEATRQQMFSQLPQIELAYTQPQLQNKQLQQWNIQNALQEQAQKRMAQQNEYNQKMQKWAAEGQSEAMKQSGGGGKK